MKLNQIYRLIHYASQINCSKTSQAMPNFCRIHALQDVHKTPHGRVNQK